MRLLPLIFLCACKVYVPACQPSEAAPVGVTVHRVAAVNGFELADEDAGTDAGDWVEARKL